MARRTPIDKLDDAIGDILKEYEGQVEKSIGEIADKLAKKGAQTLRSQSRATFRNGTGKYAKGWKAETSGKKHRQLEQSSVIYNDNPGLPHLLEHGHVTRNGTGRVYGRTPGHEHIAPVEAELVEAFEREVLAKL